MKKIILLLIMLVFLTGCGNQNPIVTMDIENYGTIELELYPNIAPNTVANFVNLIEEGFYENTTFHRLVPGFVLQGGDPKGDGTGGPDYTIKGEFAQNNFINNLSHTEGIISMARNPYSYDSAGSQFFIVLNSNAKSSLDGMYAAFGKVKKGMDVLKKIESTAEVADEETGKLKENILISNITVDTFGKTYTVEKITQTE